MTHEPHEFIDCCFQIIQQAFVDDVTVWKVFGMTFNLAKNKSAIQFDDAREEHTKLVDKVFSFVKAENNSVI
jgi:hypothetical protein